MWKRGKERSVCCTLAEYLLSLETTAHPGGNELFLLDHEIDTSAQKMSQWQPTPTFSADFMQQELDLRWRAQGTYLPLFL